MSILGHNRREGETLDAGSAPSASGWPAVYKALRDVDINKVDDCRDDIDTLLVFAGLYSAVLTAFVIESYTHLQQDSQDVIIDLLQQIAAQNFSSGPGFLNSTNPSPPIPAFEPPLWAIRVNVLWFTSLLLSLSSASFGILVKQWLREYLALDYTAPRERLRARQYRNPAMSEWKVFEIAAFLPLLLQASFGLFFVGLCFFTAAVHDSVGRTTVPLVCAWAFFFLMTIIAPLFSPRCPYKTAFLKRALKVGRRYVGPPWRRLIRTIRIFPYVARAKASSKWASLVDWVHHSILPHYRRIMGRPTTLDVRIKDLFLGVIRREIHKNAVECEKQLRDKGELLLKKERESMKEESDVVETEAEDVEILTSVYSLTSDDGLLPTMLNALRHQSEASLENVSRLALRIIGRRINRDLDPPRLTFVPDLRTLSKYAWYTITDSIAELLQHGPGPLSPRSPDWVFNSVLILFSPSQFPLSEFAAKELNAALTDSPSKPDILCSTGVYLNQCLARARVRPTDNPLDSGAFNSKTCLRCTMDVYKNLLCHARDHSHPSLRHLLDMHVPDDSFVASSKGLMQDLFDALAPFLLSAILPEKHLTDIPGSYEACYVVLQHGAKFWGRSNVVELYRQMLPTKSSARMIIIQLAALHPQRRVSDDGRGILWEAYWSTSSADRKAIRSRLSAACERFCDSDGDIDGGIPLDYVRLSAAYIRVRYGDTARALAQAVAKYNQNQGWRKAFLEDYWCGSGQSPTPEELLKEDQALACETIKACCGYDAFRAELMDTLCSFVPEERRDEVLCSIRAVDANYEYKPFTPVGRENLLGRGGETSGRIGGV